MKRTSTAFRLLSWFCDHHGIEHAKTPYDLALAIGVHPGTAIYQRISCDLRMTLGLDIPCNEPRPNTDDLHTYFLPYHELGRALAIRDTILGPPTAPHLLAEDNRKVPATPSSSSGVSPSAPELHGLESIPTPLDASPKHVMYCMTPLGLVATDGERNWIVDGTEP